MTQRILDAFGRTRRPLAWVCLVGGVVVVLLTIAGVLFADEPVAAVLGGLLLFLDGWDKVAEVEQELGTEAAVDGADA